MAVNRVNNELCVGCGMPLIYPFNEFRACSNCTPKIAKSIYETKMRKRDKNSKTQKATVIGGRAGHPIFITRKPLGTKVAIA